MDKQEIKKSLIKSAGSELLTVGQIASFMGVHRGTTRQLLAGIEYLPLGRKKLYAAADVAARITERRQI